MVVGKPQTLKRDDGGWHAKPKKRDVGKTLNLTKPAGEKNLNFENPNPKIKPTRRSWRKF